MKSLIVPALIALLLTGCGAGPGKVTKESLAISQADVPGVPKEVQTQAHEEMDRGLCPALNELATVCLVTRDQARALSLPK